ncbi:MAG: aminotransferase class I/II-fold pyridoxal phosphate-dependent enzyme [Butyrivibrio sp.]|nr:aminotransferase class I/II-fold pyridoxal phosphate-dependent enzyme [Butyrivibrio sp.]
MPELYNKLFELYNSNMYPLHMPGHKRNANDDVLKDICKIDITEIDDFDNLHMAEGILARAQERANMLYGSAETFFLVNGSTSGILSAISAVADEGDCILTARNCHKSLYNVAYLRKTNLKYYYPEYNEEYDMYGQVNPDTIEKALDSSIKAVFITSPTYEGIPSDIAKIAEIAHKRNIPLIVDEAHGAHFGFYDDIPDSAIHQGADIVIHSVHKTLPSLTQTALLHVQGNLVNRELLKRFLRIYQSSSPSYVFMASIDSCMDYLEQSRDILFGKLLEYKREILKKTSNTSHIRVLNDNLIKDPCKVVISVKNTSMTGQKLYDILREDYALQLEMAADTYGLAIITGLDTKDGIERLINAINEIDLKIDTAYKSDIFDSKCLTNKVEMPLYKAWDSKSEKIELSKADGRCMADFINLYPPGIPIIVPGEIINGDLINCIESYINKKMNIQGIEFINKIPYINVVV